MKKSADQNASKRIERTALTLREQATIAAMKATIRSMSGLNSISHILSEGFTGEKKTYPNEIAQFAVACADALIEKLNKD